jgi:carbon-monoxide dehydrogenase medium subunit
MLPTTFDYAAPDTLDAALALLQTPDAHVLAGGHSLILEMTAKRMAPSLVVDLRHLPGMVGITQIESGLRIGALTPLAQVGAEGMIQASYRALAEAAGLVGDAQIRNRAVIGDPVSYDGLANGLLAAFLALDAGFVWASGSGEMLHREPTFRAGEVLTMIHLPALSGNSAYEVLPHAASQFPIIGVAAYVEQADDQIQTCRVAVTGIGIPAARLSEVEEALVGKAATPENLATAAAIATLSAPAVTSVSPDYMAHLVKVFTRRALARASH